ncbi:MAG TPA: aldehyde dehydrogenase family protein [Solirubrobacteraceae bacterium]|nr:aldehyde dehydrogenase family protein [Solirubrobacteraceae bacterium]
MATAVGSQLEHFPMVIGGRSAEALSGRTYETENPYRAAPWATVPDCGPEDVDVAVSAARAALEGPWSAMTGFKRASLMRRLADLIAENEERLAELEVNDSGKLLREMLGQTRALGGWYLYYAGIADKLEGRQIPTPNPDYLVYTRREPVGVVAAITPWNSPLLLGSWKIAPALAAGCTLVVKPSEHSPVATLDLARLVGEAGFPPGVVNVITSRAREVGAALAGHPGVDKVAFTGSTATGRAVAHAAAENLNKVTLELGGKSPQIVFPDADLAAAANGVVAGVFAATGQTCMAGSRLIVHADVHDELIARVSERADAIRLGDPTQPDTEMGPVANRPQYEKVLGYLRTAREEGATVACGGESDDRLRSPDGVHRRHDRVHRRARGGVRPRARRAHVHRGGRSDPARERHALRPRRRRLDKGRAPRASSGGARAGRHDLDQRLSCRRAKRAFRWLWPLRPGSRERNRGRQRVPREQVGLGRVERQDPGPIHVGLSSLGSVPFAPDAAAIASRVCLRHRGSRPNSAMSRIAGAVRRSSPSTMSRRCWPRSRVT